MSFRHTLVTQFIYHEERRDTDKLIGILQENFDIVDPIYSELGKLTCIVIRSRDLDNFAVEQLEMPLMLEAAKGVLKGDLDIVAAWEAENYTSSGKPRQRVFTIRGRGR